MLIDWSADRNQGLDIQNTGKLFASMLVFYIQLTLVRTGSHNDLIIPNGLQEIRISIYLIYLLNCTACVAKVAGQVSSFCWRDIMIKKLL